MSRVESLDSQTLLLTAADLCEFSYKCRTKRFSAQELAQRMPHAVPCEAFYCQVGVNPGSVSYATMYHAASQTLFVAFRGTASWAEAKIDSEAFLETIGYGAESSQCHNRPVRVHSGFYSMCQKSFPTGHFIDFLVDQPCRHLKVDPEHIKHILLAGHSLGGAIAVLAGYNWYATLHDSHKTCAISRAKLGVITFGAPAVGNQAFATLLHRLKVPITAFLHEADLVAQAFTLFKTDKHGLQAAVVTPDHSLKSSRRKTITIPWETTSQEFTNLVREYITRDWLTGKRITVFNKTDEPYFLQSCDPYYHRKGWKRFISIQCFPSWPPNRKNWRKNPTRQLYDEYALTVPLSRTWDFSHISKSRTFTIKAIRHAHDMNSYRQNILDYF